MKLFFKKIGDGPPIIILHGLFGSSDNWVTIGNKLAEAHQHTVYLLDQRNHGQSPHSDEWNYTAMVNDIKELAEEVAPTLKGEKPGLHSPLGAGGKQSIILLGHSLGGKVAMQFASMYPEKLEKLIVVDMAPKDYPGNQFDFIEKLLTIDLSGMKSRKEVEIELKKIIRDNATIQLLLKNIQWTSSPMPHPQSLSSGEGGNSQILEWKFNLKVIAENQDKIGKTFNIKNNIATPALFIRGERSNYILDSDIPGIKKIFPNSEIKTIAGAGHWTHADKPEEFVEIVKAFIQE